MEGWILIQKAVFSFYLYTDHFIPSHLSLLLGLYFTFCGRKHRNQPRFYHDDEMKSGGLKNK